MMMYGGWFNFIYWCLLLGFLLRGRRRLGLHGWRAVSSAFAAPCRVERAWWVAAQTCSATRVRGDPSGRPAGLSFHIFRGHNLSEPVNPYRHALDPPATVLLTASSTPHPGEGNAPSNRPRHLCTPVQLRLPRMALP